METTLDMLTAAHNGPAHNGPMLLLLLSLYIGFFGYMGTASYNNEHGRTLYTQDIASRIK